MISCLFRLKDNPQTTTSEELINKVEKHAEKMYTSTNALQSQEFLTSIVDQDNRMDMKQSRPGKELGIIEKKSIPRDDIKIEDEAILNVSDYKNKKSQNQVKSIDMMSSDRKISENNLILKSGAIYIDNVDISTLGLHTLRNKISIIPQVYPLYLTIYQYL